MDVLVIGGFVGHLEIGPTLPQWARFLDRLCSFARVIAFDKQILVSNTVTDLVVGSGLRFDDRGEHDLKGVPGPWRLHAVIGDAER